ncbi:hypothetical protein PCYB_007790, partial [Plasmodium cynomolgi strain B]
MLETKKYLEVFNNEEDCKEKNCCQYINYLLNYMVRNYYSSNQLIFNIYNTYMNHKNNSNIKNFCLTEINYLNSYKYNKIHLLYTAYERCQFYISNKNASNSCNLAKQCERAYNGIINPIYTKRDDTKFCKILKDLNDYLIQNEPISTGDCGSIFSDSLYYYSECYELLNNAEELGASTEQRNGRLEVAEEIQNVVTGEAPREQKYESSVVYAPG